MPRHLAHEPTLDSASIFDHASDAMPPHQDEQLSEMAWQRLLAPPATPVDELGAARTTRLWLDVRAIIEDGLTERQRQVLELYFLRGLDQSTVARLLGMSQQSVSEHIHGKTRHGHQVGGLVRKLRKLCARAGIAPGPRGAVRMADPAAMMQEQDADADAGPARLRA